MKRLSFLVLFLCVAHGMQAQEVVVKDVYVNPGTYRSGLYNERTSGELALRDAFGKVIPLSIFVRLKR